MSLEILGIIGGAITIAGGMTAIAAFFISRKRGSDTAAVLPAVPATAQESAAPHEIAATADNAASVDVKPHTPTNMVWASVSTVLFWPAAIPAIVYASRARAAYARGDIAVAQHSYTISRRWTIAATIYFGLGVVIAVSILMAQS